MQKRTLIFLLLAVSLLSCEENDDLGDSGKVKIKAVDLNNDPLSGAEVRIYSPEENQNGVIFEDSTNASGIYDEDNFTYPYKGIYLSKGDHRQITVKVDM